MVYVMMQKLMRFICHHNVVLIFLCLIFSASIYSRHKMKALKVDMMPYFDLLG